MTEIVWARTKLQGPRPWVFLAGPTTREPERIPSWRPDAVDLFEKAKFTGTLLIPEDGPGRPPFDEGLHSEMQVFWEWDAMDLSDQIVFWVPRAEDGMQGLTTNTEFGDHVRSGKVVLGYPEDAWRCNYLNMLADRYGVNVYSRLEAMVGDAILFADVQNHVRPHHEWPEL